MSGLKLKVVPQFPAQVIGGAGVDVVKANGNYTFSLDYTDFPQIGALPTDKTYALIFDPITGQYVQAPISLLGGGVPEAPVDGQLYGRKSSAWSVVPSGGGGGGISEAPADGVSYARRGQDGTWQPALLVANNLSDVANAETSFLNLGGFDAATVISLTVASTLTTAAFGRLHFITGTAAFTTTLPTPVGNAGKMIGFLVGNAANATKLFTLTTPAGVIGRGTTSIVMWANESALLRSNGTDWEVLQSKQIPFVGKLTRATNQTGGTSVNINFTSASGDQTNLNLAYDTANLTFKSPRAGSYQFNAYTYVTQVGGSYNQLALGAAVFSYTGTLQAGTVYGSSLQSVGGNANLFAYARCDGSSPLINGAGVPSTLDYFEIVPSW
jgi:hypothetical protein